MKILITENILIAGKHTERGTVVDLEKGEAEMLKGIKRAVDATPENIAAFKAQQASVEQNAGKPQTKEQVVAALQSKGISFDPAAKKEDLLALLNQAP